MKTLKKLFQKLFSGRSLKKWMPLLALILLALCLIIFMRSCGNSNVVRKQVYVIGRDRTFYTLQLLGRERNLLAFSNDLLAAISQESGLRFAWLDTNPGSLFDSLESGTCDAILSSLRPNNFNLDKYAFSEPLFKIGPVLILRKDTSTASLEKMKGLIIGIGYGTPTLFNAIKKSGANVFDLVFVTYYDNNKALESLVNKLVDGVIIPSIPAYTLLNGIYNDSLKIVSAPLTDEGLRLIALKNESSEVLINDINRALETLKYNGTYHSLINKWNLFNAESGFQNPTSEKLN